MTSFGTRTTYYTWQSRASVRANILSVFLQNICLLSVFRIF